ncbi:unnamed protein product [marine sediment metagenome]|uniref:Uncharacterized protein n=1 Tax=marine sediment metagenome TaxID=412755 RepID=X1NLB7_9ZZZZ
MTEDNNNYWKQRAIGRRMENKAIKKRVKELIISRDGWKTKYMKSKEKKVFYFFLYPSFLPNIKKLLF